MQYQGLPGGLYLEKQHSPRKGVGHYGILDVGNRLRYPNAPYPLAIHQTPPAIQATSLPNCGV